MIDADDLLLRLRRARTNLRDLVTAHETETLDGRYEDARRLSERSRLEGKVEGVSLALSYIEEAVRMADEVVVSDG